MGYHKPRSYVRRFLCTIGFFFRSELSHPCAYGLGWHECNGLVFIFLLSVTSTYFYRSGTPERSGGNIQIPVAGEIFH